MTGPDGRFAYSQARLQARLGSRPAASDWQRVDASRDFSALLRICGASSFAPWTRDLDARMDVHEVERRLRGRWLAQVDEIAAWQPADWRDAFAWLRWLPYLPALEKLARAGKPPDWMRGDPVLGAIVAEDPRQRASSVAGTGFAPLAAGFATPPDVTQAWLRHWRSLWPVADARALERVVREVAALPGLLAATPPGASSGPDARPPRATAAGRVPPPSADGTGHGRRISASPALDLLRLRGRLALLALQSPIEDAA